MQTTSGNQKSWPLRSPIHDCDLSGQLFWLPEVVCIQDRYELALRERDSEIARCGRAGVRLPHQSEPRIVEPSDDVTRPIRRPVVDHEDVRSEEHTSELQSHHDLVCR